MVNDARFGAWQGEERFRRFQSRPFPAFFARLSGDAAEGGGFVRGGQSGGRLEECCAFPSALLGKGSRVVPEDGIGKRISYAMQKDALAANPVSSCPRFV